LIVLLCKCCFEEKRVKIEKNEAEMRVVYGNNNNEDTATSLQIDRIDPSIQQFSPTLWTHDTMNPTNNHLHPSPFGSKRCFKPSISQFSQQTIHKSANLYEYDVGRGRGNDKMIISVIGDMQKEQSDDSNIDIAYDEHADEYVTKRGDEDEQLKKGSDDSNQSNVYRKGTKTKWSNEQIVAYHDELECEMKRQRQLLKQSDEL